jgi:hypothetical protein
VHLVESLRYQPESRGFESPKHVREK